MPKMLCWTRTTGCRRETNRITDDDRARIELGCLQPGQASSVYADALNRLSDRLRYLNASGDKVQDAIQFRFNRVGLNSWSARLSNVDVRGYFA